MTNVIKVSPIQLELVQGIKSLEAKFGPPTLLQVAMYLKLVPSSVRDRVDVLVKMGALESYKEGLRSFVRMVSGVDVELRQGDDPTVSFWTRMDIDELRKYCMLEKKTDLMRFCQSLGKTVSDVRDRAAMHRWSLLDSAAPLPSRVRSTNGKVGRPRKVALPDPKTLRKPVGYTSKPTVSVIKDPDVRVIRHAQLDPASLNGMISFVQAARFKVRNQGLGIVEINDRPYDIPALRAFVNALRLSDGLGPLKNQVTGK